MTHFLLAAILVTLLLGFAVVRRGLLLAVVMLVVLWAIGHEGEKPDDATSSSARSPSEPIPPVETPRPAAPQPPRRVIQQ